MSNDDFETVDLPERSSLLIFTEDEDGEVTVSAHLCSDADDDEPVTSGDIIVTAIMAMLADPAKKRDLLDWFERELAIDAASAKGLN